MKERIGFVGVGRMGANMARRLNDRGYEISRVFDIHSETAKKLATELDSQATNSLSDVTSQADIVFTVVSDDAAMKKIFLDQEDNLLNSAEGTVFVNCATVSPEIHQQIESACKKHGSQSLEACMASSINQAREGSLYLMLGGDETLYQSLKPILNELSTQMRYIGEAGKAGQVKALVNMVMNCNTAALAEGLGLGAALGLDLDMLTEVFSQTGANSRVLETDSDDMKDRDHECYFSAAHAAKDSSIANALAKEVGVAVPISEATACQYKKMVSLNLGELDKSGIAELTFPGRLPGDF
ncbi:MAG: NAD(P)-dependent oxidoreductase [Verrucomicrobiota bacterium]